MILIILIVTINYHTVSIYRYDVRSINYIETINYIIMIFITNSNEHTPKKGSTR